MTDKVRKIKEWISKEQEGLMDTNDNFEYPEHEGAYHILCNLDAYIDSLQEEPVSEDLEEESKKYSSYIYLEEVFSDDDKEVLRERLINTFKAGAQWQAEKDLELTWEDVKMLQDISSTVYAEVAQGSVDYYQIYPTEQSFLEEVLKRFKEHNKL